MSVLWPPAPPRPRALARYLATGLLAWALAAPALAQQGIGFRFQAGFYHLAARQEYPAFQGSFSAFMLGPYYQAYSEIGGMQLGLNFIAKQKQALFNLPLVMDDFGSEGQDVALTALELEWRVGPRIKWLKPYLGLCLGYRLKAEGMALPPQDPLQPTQGVNSWYLNLPLGVQYDLPTTYGVVGVSLAYHIGLNNLLAPPEGQGGPGYRGGSLQQVRLGIYILFGDSGQ